MKRHLQCAEQQVLRSNLTNTASATQKELHALSSSHMKPHLHCAEQQLPWSNLTNTAPATQKELHALSSSHMKPHLHCAEQQLPAAMIQPHQTLRLPRKMTLQNFWENLWKQNKNVIYNAGMIWAWSEHDPRMKPSVRNPPRNRGYFSSSARTFSIEKYNVSRPGFHSKIHPSAALPRKVTLQLHQGPRLPNENWHYSTWLYFIDLLDLTLLDSSLLYLLDVTLLYLTLLYLTYLLDLTLLYLTWLYLTLPFLTLLDLTLLYLTLLHLTLLYLTLLYLILLDSTPLDSTLLDFNFTEMLFVYRKFLS